MWRAVLQCSVAKEARLQAVVPFATLRWLVGHEHKAKFGEMRRRPLAKFQGFFRRLTEDVLSQRRIKTRLQFVRVQR